MTSNTAREIMKDVPIEIITAVRWYLWQQEVNKEAREQEVK